MTSRSLYRAIDKHSPIPAYYQIYLDLHAHITNEEWQAGDLLPSESSLMEMYTSSRVTVRQALSTLEDAGLIRKEKGRGSVVLTQVKPITHDFSLPSTLCAKLGQKGINLDAELIHLRESPPTANINNVLKLGSNQPLISISRCFIYSGRPVAINDSWIAASNLPGILDEGLIDNHLSITLAQKYDLVPVRISNTLEVVHATSSDILDHLKIPYSTPLMAVSSISYLPYDVPLEFSRTLWLTDRVKFHFEMDSHSQKL